MNRKKKIKIFITVLALAIFSVFSYEVLWGKLFPFSPLIIGFTKYELPHTCIYVQDGADTSCLKRIDTLIPAVEDFHGLKFLYKPEIYVFYDSVSFIRHSFSRARFCVYPNARLFISPWAVKEDKTGKISMEIYVRHELSHSLIDQNAGLIQAFRYPQWLMEGIAVYNTHQMGTSFYPAKEETYKYIREGNFLQPMDFKTSKEDAVKLTMENSITFKYSEFACIVDYLVETYGKEKLLSFMKALLKDSDNDKMFKSVYQIEFSQAIQDFREHVNECGKNQ
jgi:hypothetical protein